MATSVYQTQNNNKCPHGYPIGACPICNGMSSGGSKDKNKPRVAGEMSYNECLAQWHKMQRAQEAKDKAELNKLNQLRLADIKDKINEQISKLQQKIDKYIEKLDNVINKLPPIIKEVATVVIKPIVNFTLQIAKQILVVVSNISNFIASVGEKLASIYGEVKNFINDKIKEFKEKAKVAVKTVLSLFLEKNEDDDSKRKVKKMLEKLFKITGKKIIEKKSQAEKKAEKEIEDELV